MGCNGSKLVVVTYNLFWWCVSDEYKNCPQYKDGLGFEKMYRTISDNPADLLGLQECDDVVQVIKGAGLQGYDYYAPPKGNDAPMAWSQRFERLEGPQSVWVAKDKWGDRFLNWVRLKDHTTHTAIFFANTHGPLKQCGDNIVAENYLKAVEGAKKAGDQVVFTGDFNCASLEPTLARLNEEFDIAGTDLSFGGADHVLTSKGVQMCASNTEQGYPSDHQLLKVELVLPEPLPDELPAPVPPPAPAPAMPAVPGVASADAKADSTFCPKTDNGPCCTMCATNRFCPQNQGCYSAGQVGCPGALCPEPAPTPLHT